MIWIAQLFHHRMNFNGIREFFEGFLSVFTQFRALIDRIQMHFDVFNYCSFKQETRNPNRYQASDENRHVCRQRKFNQNSKRVPGWILPIKWEPSRGGSLNNLKGNVSMPKDDLTRLALAIEMHLLPVQWCNKWKSSKWISAELFPLERFS